MSEKFNDYAGEVADRLRAAGIRTEVDDSPEKIGAKIRKATLEKVPYMAVVGRREAESATVSVRHRTGGDKGAIPTDEFLAAMEREIQSKEYSPSAAKSE